MFLNVIIVRIGSGKTMIHCFDSYILCIVRAIFWFVLPALRPISHSVWTPPRLPLVNKPVHRILYTDCISSCSRVANGVMFGGLRVPSLLSCRVKTGSV